MMNDKMVIAIAKAVGKEVKIETVKQNGKDIVVVVDAQGEGYKAVLSERKNQYSSYYRVMHLEPIEVAEIAPKDETFENGAMENLQAAQKISATISSPVYVMSNGKRTEVIKTDRNKARHEKYGYWIAAIFEGGVRVSA